MSIASLKTWIQARLAEIEPSIGEPSPHNAAIVAELKQRCYEAGLYELSLTLPIVRSKHGVSAAAQLQRILQSIETPPPAVDGGDMSVVQAARLLGISKESVYGLCASGDLECNRHGKRITISPQQLADYRRQSAR